jgi:hypothetical protein
MELGMHNIGKVFLELSYIGHHFKIDGVMLKRTCQQTPTG